MDHLTRLRLQIAGRNAALELAIDRLESKLIAIEIADKFWAKAQSKARAVAVKTSSIKSLYGNRQDCKPYRVRHHG